MKTNEIAEKIYDILEKRWERQFEESDYSEWKDFLSKYGIELRDYNVDQAYVMFDDMMFLNERKDAVFLKDPQREGVGHDAADWLVMLVVPKKLAERILVLGDLP